MADIKEKESLIRREYQLNLLISLGITIAFVFYHFKYTSFETVITITLGIIYGKNIYSILKYIFIKNKEKNTMTHENKVPEPSVDIRIKARDLHNNLLDTYPEFNQLSPLAQNALREALISMRRELI